MSAWMLLRSGPWSSFAQLLGGKRWQSSRGGLGMARIIVFYIPTRFRKKAKWLALKERGKVIPFPKALRKSA
jgi:hypothetical protein